MTAPWHGPQQARRRPIGRRQAPPMVDTVPLPVQEAIDTGEVIA